MNVAQHDLISRFDLANGVLVVKLCGKNICGCVYGIHFISTLFGNIYMSESNVALTNSNSNPRPNVSQL